jgi:hypothetical protein
MLFTQRSPADLQSLEIQGLGTVVALDRHVGATERLQHQGIGSIVSAEDPEQRVRHPLEHLDAASVIAGLAEGGNLVSEPPGFHHGRQLFGVMVESR